jgi:hypothetical protein
MQRKDPARPGPQYRGDVSPRDLHVCSSHATAAGEWARRKRSVHAFYPSLDEMVTDGLVTLETVNVISYRGSPRDEPSET